MHNLHKSRLIQKDCEKVSLYVNYFLSLYGLNPSYNGNEIQNSLYR